MKKKCVFLGFFSIIVCGMTACGSVFSVESVEAKELDVVIIKDELAVTATDTPTVENKDEKENIPLKMEKPVEEAYVVMASTNVEEEVADGKVDESDFVAEVQGTAVKLGEEINKLMYTLGRPDSFVETVSNPRIGSDKEYKYEGIVIHTNPINRKDIINSIEYCGEEKTLSGIGVGSTRADIEAAYGIEYEIDPDYITYTYGENASICFQMEGEECVHIRFSWKQ